MNIAARVTDINSLRELCRRDTNVKTVILGHENCPEYYRQSNVDGMIAEATEAGMTIKVDLPVAFEKHLPFIKKESERLLEKYPSVKLTLNDWGMMHYLHERYPETTFAVGKGCSFTYMDCPWNEHIMEGEKIEYRQVLGRAHNMGNEAVMEALRSLNVDEIELSNHRKMENVFRILKENGFTVVANRGLTVVSMMRACHSMRFLDRVDEIGEDCAKYCKKGMWLKTNKYYDMVNNEPKPLSESTKDMQPIMRLHANILVAETEEECDDYSNVDIVVLDERLMELDDICAYSNYAN